MKAKRSILGLILVIGMLLSCAVSAYATATKAPKITTSKIADGTHGQAYPETKIEVQDNTTSQDARINVSITDKASTDLAALGFTLSYSDMGGLILKSDKLLSPTTGYKFTVTATNQYEKKSGDGKWQNGKATKDYTLKIKGVDPVISSPAIDGDNGNDITEGYPLKNAEITPIYIATASASPKVEMTATGLPTGLSLVKVEQPEEGEPAPAIYAIEGTPTKSGTFTVKVTAQNTDKKKTGVSKKSTVSYKLNIYESPDITPESFKDVTYGKKFSQKFTITGVSKETMLPASAVEVFAYAADGTVVSLDKYSTKAVSDGGLTYAYDTKKGVITISGIVDNIDMGDAKDTSFDVGFKLTSPALPNAVEKTMKVKVNGVAPKINDKKTPQEGVSSLMRLTAMDNVDIIAVGPGTISWGIDSKTPLPAGITSEDPVVVSDDDGNIGSRIRLTGTPEETKKGYGVNFTATNGAGTVKLTLKFTIDGTDPVVTIEPNVTSTDTSPYAELPVNSVDVKITLTADTGPVTWKAAKLPKGLTLSMSPDKNAKTSQIAEITGKATAAMKASDVITITATDPNTKRTSGPIELLGLKVYAAPTIKGRKFADVKIGSEYASSIKAEGATEWVVTKDAAADIILSSGLELDSSDVSELKISGTLNAIPLSGDKPVTTGNFEIQAKGPGGDSTVLKAALNIKGTAPKFATSKLASDYESGKAGNNTIDVTGSKPINFDAYVVVKDAKKVYLPAEYASSKDTDKIPVDAFGFTLTSADSDNGLTLTLAKEEGGEGSYKNLPITFEADNGIGKKATTKVYKVTVKGNAPTLYFQDEEVTDELIKYYADKSHPVTFLAKSNDVQDFVFRVEGDLPINLTVSPNKDTAGLKIINSSDYEGSGYPGVVVSTTSTSEAKNTKVTVTAKNGDGTVKFVVTLAGQVPPVIDTKTAYSKEVESGKKLSIALKLSQGKSAKWAIADDSEIDAETLEETYGLTLDEDKGKLEGTALTPTISDDGSYAKKTVLVYAYIDDIGESSPVSVDFGIMGKKPKIDKDSKTLLATRGESVSKELKVEGLEADDNYVVWDIEEKNNKKTLADYVKGLELLSGDSMIEGTPEEAVKGVSVPMIVENAGTKVKTSMKITVYDPKPEILADDPGYIAITGVAADEKGKVSATKTGSITLTVSNDTGATGTSKVTWKAAKPENKNISVKIEVTDATHGNAAKVTASLNKGKAVDTGVSGDVLSFETTVDVTATNSGALKGENSDTITLKIYVVSGDTVTVNAAPKDEAIGSTRELEEDIVTDDDLTRELGEGEVTIGEERTVGMLTAGQAAILDEGSFIIAAVLPEISATADGQYGFEVDLEETVKTGAKLYWFAFPKDAEDSEDDQIADFFTEEGEDTEVVTEDHVVVVYPWMRAGVTYGPVIAVKAEDAEEGEAVTEGELEQAAEGENASEVTEVEEPSEEAAE